MALSLLAVLVVVWLIRLSGREAPAPIGTGPHQNARGLDQLPDAAVPVEPGDSTLKEVGIELDTLGIR